MKTTQHSPEAIDYVLTELIDRFYGDGINYLPISDCAGNFRTAIIINKHDRKRAIAAIADELPVRVQVQGDICRITAI
jgi:hypothetical protein